MVKSLRDIEERLDITKKHPGYINKNIFRVGFLIIILLFIASAWQEDFDFSQKEYEITRTLDGNEVVYGEQPGFLYQYFMLFTLVIIILTWGINHWRYKWK